MNTRWIVGLSVLLLCGCADDGRDVYGFHEITAPTPIVGPDGAVNEAAHGWARGPLMQYERASVDSAVSGQLREWDYYAIFAPTFMASVTIVNVGLTAAAIVSVTEYETGETSTKPLLGPKTLTLGATPFEYTRWELGGGYVETTYEAGARTLRYRAGEAEAWEGAQVDLSIWDDPEAEHVAVVTTFPPEPSLFFYENKRIGLVPSGTIRIGERSWEVPAEGAFAMIDWGRGAWPSEVVWEWAAAAGEVDGHRVALNLGNVGGDDSAGTPDVISVDGVLHKLPPVRWEYDLDHMEEPWRFVSDDGRVDLTMTPTFDESGGIGALMITKKMHGDFSGTVGLDDGSVFVVDGVRGAAEQVTIDW